MPHEKELTPAQQELEATLAALSPAPVNIERDRIMFQAGRASARRHTLFWPLLSVVLAGFLTVSLLIRSTPTSVEFERVVYIPVQTGDSWDLTLARAEAARPDRPESYNTGSYFKLRDKVITKGVDALPVTESSSSTETIESWENLLEIM